jgi:hypothetical protein
LQVGESSRCRRAVKVDRAVDPWERSFVRSRFLAALLCFVPGGLSVAGGPFRAVMIDAASEKIYGNFPFDRALTAQAMTKLRAAGVKAIILKFFYDLPSNETSEKALAAAIAAGPTALQACLRQDEPNPSPLPDRFFWRMASAAKPLAGDSGWIPRPEFAKGATTVGFVDFRVADQVPLMEQYRGQIVKSLYASALEFATGAPATLAETNRLLFGAKSLRLNDSGEVGIQFPKADRLGFTPFHEVLSSPVEKLKPVFSGQIAITAYDGEKEPKVSTPIGEMKVHRFFLLTLDAVYEALEPK